MIFEHHSCRTYLKEVLGEGLRNNSISSLRDLAQRLDLSPSFLSEILNGKRSLSEEKAARTAVAMRLSENESTYFNLMVRYDSCRDMALKDSLLNQMQKANPAHKLNDLSVDQFKAMSEWYYGVILELLNVRDFSFNIKNIASRLDLPAVTIESALERLLRIGLIAKTDDGYARVHDREFVDSVEHRNAALCQYHTQLLDRSKAGLENQEPAAKHIGTEVFAFDLKDIEKARQIIETCFDQLVALADTGTNKTEVYYAGIQFLNVSRT